MVDWSASLCQGRRVNSTEPYFSDRTLSLIAKARTFVDTEDLWQMRLLDETELSKDAKKKRLADFSGEEIRLLWCLGLLTADSVHSPVPLDEPGLVQSKEHRGWCIYQDHRSHTSNHDGLESIFSRLGDDPYPDVKLLFHPFRSYLMYRLTRVLRNRIVPSQFLWSTEEFRRLTDGHVEELKSWFQSDGTATVLSNVNHLSSFCIACEPPAHQVIFSRVRSSGLISIEAIERGLGEASKMAGDALLDAGKAVVEHCRKELCRMSEELDPNKNLHLIVRLMKARERDRLGGHIAGSMLFFYMAESLRRNLERALSEQLPEEDEMGFGTVFRSAKRDLQGAVRILDGRRVDSNQFLRRFGLDQGIRVNVYVEGATEKALLESEFDDNSSVLVIDLSGRFVEARGRGLSFRESIENDLKSKVFSVIMLDADRVDNVRVVQQAARQDLICGQFYLCNPDVEFSNFTVHELCAIAREAYEIDPATDIASAVAGCENARSFFCALGAAGVQRAKKGKDWGAALGEYAVRNPQGEFGGASDRLVNKLIRMVHQCCSFTYESTRQLCRVDPASGQLVAR